MEVLLRVFAAGLYEYLLPVQYYEYLGYFTSCGKKSTIQERKIQGEQKGLYIFYALVFEKNSKDS